jgi:hypothetical protein
VFWVLRPYGGVKFGRRYSSFDIEDPHLVGSNLENGTCPVCGMGLGSLPWLPPQRISLDKPSFPDFLWGPLMPFLISERAKALYRAAALEGVREFHGPVEICKVGNARASVHEVPTSYYLPRLVHDGARVDDQRSGARRSSRCHYCRQSIEAMERLVFEEGSWSGCDIFIALGLPGKIIVTERFKQMVEKNGLTNASFVAAQDFRFSF